VFLIFVIILVILPFWLTVQDILTRIVMSFSWYRLIQNGIVPYELRTIQTILHTLGFSTQAGEAYIQWVSHGQVKEVIYLAWNCIGWQTFILFIVTLISGLSGNHTWSSKVETFLIGLLGTYLMNIFRLTLVIVVYISTGRLFGTIFHDYFSNIFTLCWLFFFWWLSYRYVLVEKEVKQISAS
jgi:exosortase/archaeosortase family protein